MRYFAAGSVIAVCVAAAGVLGCQRSVHSVHAGNASDVARELTIQNITTQLRNAGLETGTDSSTVSIKAQRSSVVPGLEYYFGGYYPPEVSHRYFTAVSGAREGTARLILTPSDWASMLGGWFPNRAETALTACQELIVALKTRGPGDAAFVGRDTLNSALLASELDDVLAGVSPPEISSVGHGTWITQLWVVQRRSPRGAVRYRCVLNPDPPQATLVATDSIVFPDVP